MNDALDEKWVRLEGVKASADPVGLVGVFAPKTADIISRYRLPNTTNTEVEGIIYYRAPEKNDLRVKFRHPTGTGRYQLFGEDYFISAPVGDLTFKGPKLDFDVTGGLYGAPMSARGSVDLRPESDSFSVKVKADRFPYEVFSRKLPFERVTADVRQAGRGVEFNINASLLNGGVSLIGETEAKQPEAFKGEISVKNVSLPRVTQFNGIINDWQALKGNGALTILNGDLYSIPIVGLLAPMLGTILPKQIAGYNIAKEADCTFDVADGFILTKDFEALTSTFKILLEGRIDFIRDALDLTAQVRVRGLPGIVFLPFSELLQYKGEGSISKARWTSKILKGVTPDKRTNKPEADKEKPAPEPTSPKLQLRNLIPPIFNR